MPNSWFQFREFRIEQGRSAMKVCSDSCLFGALVARMEAAHFPNPVNILDPGCGTGLLGLMLAQRLPAARITGVELHPGSAADCLLNYSKSPWHERLELFPADLRNLPAIWHHTFDCIICNPPFFISQLPAPDPDRRRAMHAGAADIQDWLKILANCLKPGGRCWILAAELSQTAIEENLRDAGLGIRQKIFLMRKETHVWRLIYCLESGYHPGYREETWFVQDEKARLLPAAKELLISYYDA